MDAYYTSLLVDFISVIIVSCMSTLAVIVNLINIKVLLSIKFDLKSEEAKQVTLIRLMTVYSFINLAYSIINLLSLLSKCIAENSLFCSYLYHTEFSQYFKIIVVEYLGNILKIFSNVVYLLVSISRYVLLEKDGKLAKFVQNTFQKMKKKTIVILVLVLILFVSGLNSHRIFIYKVLHYSIFRNLYDYNTEYFLSFPTFLTDSKIYKNYITYEKEDDIHARTVAYEVFVYLNFILNDVVLFILFTVVDILLIVGLRRSIEKKKKMVPTTSNIVNLLPNQSEISNENNKMIVQINEIEKTEKNILKSVIANTIILLVAKVFDLFFTIAKFNIWNQDLVNLNYSTKLNAFCHTVKICTIYEDMIKILYIGSYSFSTIMFYNMNKSFRVNFKLC